MGMKPPIKLQSGEELKLVIRRSKASLVVVWAMEVVVIGAIILLFGFVVANLGSGDASLWGIMEFLMVFLVLAAIGTGIMDTYLNFKNKMFVTDRRIVYEKMPNLLSHEIKVIDLTDVEDVSYKKEGVLANLLGYGTLRLSTDSDETTYVFPYCNTPSGEIETITGLINTANRNRKASSSENRHN